VADRYELSFSDVGGRSLLLVARRKGQRVSGALLHDGEEIGRVELRLAGLGSIGRFLQH
jgi:hypothetical protein